jgi:hypothetical protein
LFIAARLRSLRGRHSRQQLPFQLTEAARPCRIRRADDDLHVREHIPMQADDLPHAPAKPIPIYG